MRQFCPRKQAVLTPSSQRMKRFVRRGKEKEPRTWKPDLRRWMGEDRKWWWLWSIDRGHFKAFITVE